MFCRTSAGPGWLYPFGTISQMILGSGPNLTHGLEVAYACCIVKEWSMTIMSIEACRKVELGDLNSTTYLFGKDIRKGRRICEQVVKWVHPEFQQQLQQIM